MEKVVREMRKNICILLCISVLLTGCVLRDTEPETLDNDTPINEPTTPTEINTEITIPDISNVSAASAEQILINAGLIPVLAETEHDSIAKGNVVSCSPEIGCLVEANSRVTVYVSTGNYVENTYNEALSLLQEGKYTEANELFSEIPDYKDVSLLREQLTFESYAYPILQSIYNDRTSSEKLLLYSLEFYNADIYIDMNFDGQNNDDGIVNTIDYPVCIVYYGIQNQNGEIISAFTLGAYSIESQKYTVIGSCETLETDNITAGSWDTFFETWKIYHVCDLINKCYDYGTVTGTLNIERLDSLLSDYEVAPLLCCNSDCTDIGRYSFSDISGTTKYFCKQHYEENKLLLNDEIDSTLESALSKFNVSTDKVTGNTTYSSSVEPEYADIRSFVLPNIVFNKETGAFGLRLTCHFTGDSWLFIEKLIFSVDGENYHKELGYNDVKRDNDSGNVWEWTSFLPTKDERTMLQNIVNSTETIVRFQGDTYYYDLTISAEDKQVIGDFLYASELLSKKYVNLNDYYENG